MDASSAMVARSKTFVVARNKHVVPKQRRIERLTAGTRSKSLETIPKAATGTWSPPSRSSRINKC
jgi:hypothetical protein